MKFAVLFLAFSFAALGFNSWETVSAVTSEGELSSTVFSNCSQPSQGNPVADTQGILWHYSLESGATQKVAPIGFDDDFVFAGGWYGGGQMFQGIGGSGTVNWTAVPAVGADEYVTALGTGTAAACSSDLFYTVQTFSIYNDNGTPGDTSDDFLVSENNACVSLYNSSSASPVWVWSGAASSFVTGAVDTPGKYACSDDGSVFAAGGAMNGHLAVQFFNSSSSTPLSTWEAPSVEYYPRQLRITADGSKCILRTAATLYRVDVATGTLEATYALDASNDCFAVSPDGSVVAYGFTAARIATWDGSGYNLTAGTSTSGYYGGAAAIASDNETIYFGFYKNTYMTNRIIRYSLSENSVLWTYDYPAGSGANQDVMEWMECSIDGRWLVAGSWGCENGGGPEVEVFDDLNPSAPVFTIDTPGSIFHVDISPDGRYISATGKHVHANTMGSGSDIYFAEIDVLGLEEDQPSNSLDLLSLSPNPARGQFNISFSIPSGGSVSICVFDLSGRVVQNLADTQLSAGNHNMSFANDLDTGVYFCRINACGETTAAKLVVAK